MVQYGISLRHLAYCTKYILRKVDILQGVKTFHNKNQQKKKLMKLLVDRYAKVVKSPSDKYPLAGQVTVIGATFWVKDLSGIAEGEYDSAEFEVNLRDNAPLPSKLIKVGKKDG